jgi:hypothetical protein
MAVTDRPCTRQVASSHHPPELLLPVFLFVHFFDLRRRHALREGQRQRIPVIRARLAALLHVGFGFQHRALRGKYTLNRPHPDPSPLSGD